MGHWFFQGTQSTGRPLIGDLEDFYRALSRLKKGDPTCVFASIFKRGDQLSEKRLHGGPPVDGASLTNRRTINQGLDGKVLMVLKGK